MLKSLALRIEALFNLESFCFFTQDNLEEKFLIELSNALIKEKNQILWGCYSRLDRLSEENATLFANAGCRLMFTGFETLNRNVQKKIRKIIDNRTSFNKLQHYNSHGIQFIGSFILGFNNETEDDIEETMLFAIECAAGLKIDQLNEFIKKTSAEDLPNKSVNICPIHPLAYMPGTDTFAKVQGSLHMSRYSIHPDCYGSYTFSYEEFKDDWSYLGVNPYLNHLPEEKVRKYCSTLRLFNLLNSRPYFFALLLFLMKETPLALVNKMIAHLGEEFVLTSKIKEFESASKDFVKLHLDNVPDWTVRKGQ